MSFANFQNGLQFINLSSIYSANVAEIRGLVSSQDLSDVPGGLASSSGHLDHTKFVNAINGGAQRRKSSRILTNTTKERQKINRLNTCISYYVILENLVIVIIAKGAKFIYCQNLLRRGLPSEPFLNKI